MKIINSKLILIIFLFIILITGIFFISGCELIEEGSKAFDYLSKKAIGSGPLPKDSGLTEEDVRVLKLDEAAYEAEEEYRKEKEKKMEETILELLLDDKKDIGQNNGEVSVDSKDTKSEGQIEEDGDAVKWITDEQLEELEKIKISKATYQGEIENGYVIGLVVDFLMEKVSGIAGKSYTDTVIAWEIEGKIDLSNYKIEADMKGQVKEYDTGKEYPIEGASLHGELSDDLKSFNGYIETELDSYFAGFGGSYKGFSLPLIKTE